MDEIRDLGFSSAEMCHKFLNASEELIPKLAARGLTLASGWCDVLFIDEEYEKKYMEELIKHAQFLKRMGCRYVICCEIGNSSNMDPRFNREARAVVKLDDREYERLGRNLSEAGEIINSMGMQLVYHVHAGTVVETLAETKKLLSYCKDGTVFILADTGHQLYCGDDPLEFIEELGGVVTYIHFKDVRQDILDICRQYNMDFKSSVRNNVFTVPGDGDIPLEPIIAYLGEIGYQGYIVVEAEQNPKYANPMEYGRKAVDYLTGTLGLPVINPVMYMENELSRRK